MLETCNMYVMSEILHMSVVGRYIWKLHMTYSIYYYENIFVKPIFYQYKWNPFDLFNCCILLKQINTS